MPPAPLREVVQSNNPRGRVFRMPSRATFWCCCRISEASINGDRVNKRSCGSEKGGGGAPPPRTGGAALYLVCMHLGIDQVLLWIRSGPMCAFCVGAYMRMAMRHGTVEFFFSAGLLIFSSVGHAPNGVAVNFCRLSIFQSGLKM